MNNSQPLCSRAAQDTPASTSADVRHETFVLYLLEPDTLLSTQLTPTYSISITTLWRRHYHDLHCVDEETEAKMNNLLCQFWVLLFPISKFTLFACSVKMDRSPFASIPITIKKKKSNPTCLPPTHHHHCQGLGTLGSQTNELIFAKPPGKI